MRRPTPSMLLDHREAGSAEACDHGAPHVCTDGLGLPVDDVLPDSEFPQFG